jgi:spermidine/putrescine-binding protein
MTKPLSERLTNYEWAAAAFPSAVPGLEDVSYCSLDVLVIPKMARHKKEAMEFIAYVNRQEVMEKLCKSHCKNTPLAKVSEDFLNNHPNPYIDVFERLLSSEHCQSDPQMPILAETYAEISNIAQRLSLLETTAGPALEEAQVTLQGKYEAYQARRAARGK